MGTVGTASVVQYDVTFISRLSVWRMSWLGYTLMVCHSGLQKYTLYIDYCYRQVATETRFTV